MSQVFTTLFSYQGKTFTAVISQPDRIVHIYVPDVSLHELLPQGKATYDPANRLQPHAPVSSPAQQLIHCILGTLVWEKEQGSNVIKGKKG
ncbi:hypothetical protein V9K67_25775 [Paraflavisolibacter sp. H34]|uniref:hypothetical protein n=1 Tax=Huijunlia imazamoxiresistens TaxID=3127457 RepID=UPI00301AF208